MSGHNTGSFLKLGAFFYAWMIYMSVLIGFTNKQTDKERFLWEWSGTRTEVETS